MSQLDILISELNNGIKEDNHSFDDIKDKALLLTSLNELRNVIGMDRLKDSVASQVQYLITMSKESKSKRMLNTVLYGPPGTGKTTVGTILAKIWYSLGYLDGEPTTVSDKITTAMKKTDGETMFYIFILIGYGIYYLILFLRSINSKIGYQYTILLIIGIILLAYILYMVYKYNSSKSNTNIKTISNQISKSNKHKNGKQGNKNKKGNKDGKEDNDRGNNNKDKKNVGVPDYSNLIKIVSREDFVAGYVGQTAIKTKNLLESNKGRVTFIDEAYSLLHDPRDSFGMEALTTLNLYMSEHPNSTIVIFGGYKDLMQTGIFKAQPGLPRRCMWHFECTPYNGNELFEIFKRQLKKEQWSIHKDEVDDVMNLFKQNADCFPNFGGDTERLAFYSQLEYSKDSITGNTLQKSKNLSKILTLSQIERGLRSLKENNIHNSNTNLHQENNLATDGLNKVTNLNQLNKAETLEALEQFMKLTQTKDK